MLANNKDKMSEVESPGVKTPTPAASGTATPAAGNDVAGDFLNDNIMKVTPTKKEEQEPEMDDDVSYKSHRLFC